MMNTTTLLAFFAASLVLAVTPGPGVIYIVTRTLAQGRAAGVASIAGVACGNLANSLGAALGLAALFAVSSLAFMVVKYAGAAYLLYVGLAMLRGRGPREAEGEPARPAPPVLSYRKIFLQGFLTNALNPKVAVFFLAFVPQFIAAEAPDKALAFILLGCIFNVNSMLWCHFLAVSSALASRRIRVGRTLTLWVHRSIGALFVSFGLRLALSGRGS